MSKFQNGVFWVSAAAATAAVAYATYMLMSRPKKVSDEKPKKAQKTPAEDGFYMPAEWEPHECTWMAWPHRPDNWRRGGGGGAEGEEEGAPRPAQLAFADVARAIARFEPVKMLVGRAHLAAARALLGGHPGVELIEMETDDAWCRDTGPLFLVNGSTAEKRGVDFEFNSWGGKDDGCYYPYDKDNAVAGQVLALAGARRHKSPMVLEGGSVHFDGEGTCLTTEECLLNPNRNPGMTRAQIEGELRACLGVEKVIWLKKGCVNDDDTNGHIDNFACFVKPGHVLLHWTDDTTDPQHEISMDALNVLKNSTDAKGRRLQVHKIPIPGPLYSTAEEVEGVENQGTAVERRAGERLAGSYVNFYLPTGGVVVPGFGVPQDAPAVAVLRELFPDREVIQVPSREILLGGGNIHCITQQQPRYPLLKK
ncbi:unnamed protein product [Heterosigma akashiwo]